jgi:hypothetical protein
LGYRNSDAREESQNQAFYGAAPLMLATVSMDDLQAPAAPSSMQVSKVIPSYGSRVITAGGFAVDEEASEAARDNFEPLTSGFGQERLYSD